MYSFFLQVIIVKFIALFFISDYGEVYCFVWLREWIWEESVWKVRLFKRRNKWWKNNKKFMSDAIDVVDNIIF